MVFELKTEATIAAPPTVVWEILTAFDKYPEWNPFVNSISVQGGGECTEGATLEITVKPPGGSQMGFKPRVMQYTQGKVLEWRGSVLFAALFNGTHRFVLTDTGDGGTHFAHSETFAGWLLAVPGFKNELDTKTRAGFEEMNAAIKARAETQFQTQTQ